METERASERARAAGERPWTSYKIHKCQRCMRRLLRESGAREVGGRGRTLHPTPCPADSGLIGTSPLPGVGSSGALTVIELSRRAEGALLDHCLSISRSRSRDRPSFVRTAPTHVAVPYWLGVGDELVGGGRGRCGARAPPRDRDRPGATVSQVRAQCDQLRTRPDGLTRSFSE